jgi:hypothetical protein
MRGGHQDRIHRSLESRLNAGLYEFLCRARFYWKLEGEGINGATTFLLVDSGGKLILGGTDALNLLANR